MDVRVTFRERQSPLNLCVGDSSAGCFVDVWRCTRHLQPKLGSRSVVEQARANPREIPSQVWNDEQQCAR